jgi:DNA-binding response OmpR family regulator
MALNDTPPTDVKPECDPTAATAATLATAAGAGVGRRAHLHEIVIVDAECSRYGEVVAAARQGAVGVHVCVDGRSAVRLSRQFRADAWVVAAELPDMSGIDLIGLLARHVQQADVDPLRSGSRISLGHLDRIRRPAIYLLGDSYRAEDEQRALAAGVSAYLVRPFDLDTLLNSRFRRTR